MQLTDIMEDVEVHINGNYFATKEIPEDEVESMLAEPEPFRCTMDDDEVARFKGTLTRNEAGLTLDMVRIH